MTESKPNFDDIIDRQALDNLHLMNPLRKTPTSCDQRCYDLAMNFLRANGQAYPDYGRELGGEIQELIEAFIENLQQEGETP